MILNHHRLCQQRHHPLLPLNLIDLFQATQQIGAFQRRVRHSLSQVLFSAFHGVNFWERWAQWIAELLQSWTHQIPQVCLTPGLLPLQAGSVTWSWRETIAIQAMALEAAQQLVATLPLTPESLEMLLGLQDALVEDSSTIDPKGFEMVPLGLPFLPNELGNITAKTDPCDPMISHLPLIQVRCSPESPQKVSAPQILSHWLWQMAQRFGPQVSYLGLILISEMAKSDQPWQGTVSCEAMPHLSHFEGEFESPRQSLEIFSRRLGVLRHAMIRWEEQRLAIAQVQIFHDPIWQIEQLQFEHPLSLAGCHGQTQHHYQEADLEAIRFEVRPGVWCERLFHHYGQEELTMLLQLSHVARQLLCISPIKQGWTAQVALFLVAQFWQGNSQSWTIRQILEAVGPQERIQTLSGHSMRQDAFFQDWTDMVQQFQAIGWQVSHNPLQDWQHRAIHPTDWLDESFFIHIQPQPNHVNALETSQNDQDVSYPTSSDALPCIKHISREALQNALNARGMSQAMLARSLNLDRSTINRWVNGSRPIHHKYRPLLWNLLGDDLNLD